MPFWHYYPDKIDRDSIRPIGSVLSSPQVGDVSKVLVQPTREKGRTTTSDQEQGGPVAAYKQHKKIHQKYKRAVCASQIMRAPVVHVLPHTRLIEARQIIKERRFRHLPVVSDEGVLCGIVSDRDLFIDCEGEQSFENKRVDSIITDEVITEKADTYIHDIARVLLEEHIGCMPIVNDAKKVMGIITRSDILRALIKRAPLDIWA